MTKPVIRLYTRPECCLCDDMKHALKQQQQHYDFSVEIYNIDKQPELKEKLNDYIPVVMWGQEVICYHRFDQQNFQERLGF